MTVKIQPLGRNKQHRTVQIGQSGTGRLKKTRNGHVLEGLNRWRAYNGMRFPTVRAAQRWLKEQFADVDEETTAPDIAGSR